MVFKRILERDFQAITPTTVNALALYSDFPLLIGLNFISNSVTLAKFPFYLHVDRKNY